MTDQKKTISSVADIPAVADYLKRINARARSFRMAAVELRTGRYDREVATIRFSQDGTISAPEMYAPTEGEAMAITEAFKGVTFPTSVPLTALGTLPIELQQTPPENLFTFYDEAGQIVMVQQRVEREGGKGYVPWSYWSDGQWRCMEPDTPHLPLWGLEQLKEHSVVFIHEGAKAARAVREQVEGQRDPITPWISELGHAAHLGWIGGAPNPHRTDWSVLRRKGVKRAYIVADNDAEGRQAVPFISHAIDVPALLVQFSQEWPDGFDLGDPFPDDMWDDATGERTYKGPSFVSTLHPATWATHEIVLPAEGRGRPRRVHELRPAFAAQWSWVEQVDLFINNEFPSIQLKRDSFNASVRAFSHVKDTAALLQTHFTGRSATLTYRPDTTKRFVVDDGVSALNLYRPPLVKPRRGDVAPWIEFLEYMFPVPEEREVVMRWCATLIAKPETRMAFGLLILSEMQGVGKTTLGLILADLVGRHNVSFPGVSMIVEQQFTGWLANKRLVIVNEIYEGHSWKAYNRLKTYLTDDYIEANIKHMATYTIPNWTHYYLCSNEMNALKVEDKDRRWFIPRVTEEAWGRERFEQFRRWLGAGGLQHIAAWAASYGQYVLPGEVAPMTKGKGRLIEESRSEAEGLVHFLAETIMANDQARVIPLSWVRDWCKQRLQTSVIHESERRLGLAMKRVGVAVAEESIRLKGKTMKLVTNRPELLEPSPEREERLMAALVHPKNIIDEEF